METRSAIKVGIVALTGIGLFITAWLFFSHLDLDHYMIYATFNNTIGLQAQTPLRMNGVTIGEVKAIKLDQSTLHPVVTLAIRNEFKNKIPDDSTIQITSGVLISNPQIEVHPGVSSRYIQAEQFWPEKYVVREPLNALAQLSPEADQAIKQLTVAMQTLTPRLSSTIDNVQGILKRTDNMMANFEAASLSTRELLADPKIRLTMRQSMDDLGAVSHEARETANVLSTELKSTVKRNSSKVDQLANGAVEILQNMADTVDAARTAVTRISEQVSDPRIQQSLTETLELAKTTIARFNQIASDIHQLSGDPNVQNDLKTSVSTLREATAEGQRVVEKVNTLVSSIKVPTGKNNFGIGRPSLSIDLITRGQRPHFRSDINMRIPFGRDAFNLGLYNFAEGNKLTAQYETGAGAGDLRYGLYASKLGVGLDWPQKGASVLSLDLYDPNHLQLNARARFRINDDFSVWMGAESIFGRTTPLIGVRLQR